MGEAVKQDSAVVRVRGDEAALFQEFNPTLMDDLRRSLPYGAPETIEDASAFAWVQFLRRQPDRQLNWQGWLFRTALRQAWRLERDARRHSPSGLKLGSEGVSERASQADEIDLRERLVDALAMVSRIAPRLRRVALLRALGFKHHEIGELTDSSLQRVDRLVVRASDELREMLVERAYGDRPPSARAARLWELEHNPPNWLVKKIGRPVRPSHKAAVEGRRRAWRRAALALDDYRREAGTELLAALGEGPPADLTLRPIHAKAMRALQEHETERRPARVRTAER